MFLYAVGGGTTSLADCKCTYKNSYFAVTNDLTNNPTMKVMLAVQPLANKGRYNI